MPASIYLSNSKFVVRGSFYSYVRAALSIQCHQLPRHYQFFVRVTYIATITSQLLVVILVVLKSFCRNISRLTRSEIWQSRVESRATLHFVIDFFLRSFPDPLAQSVWHPTTGMTVGAAIRNGCVSRLQLSIVGIDAVFDHLVCLR